MHYCHYFFSFQSKFLFAIHRVQEKPTSEKRKKIEFENFHRVPESSARVDIIETTIITIFNHCVKGHIDNVKYEIIENSSESMLSKTMKFHINNSLIMFSPQERD